MHGDVNPGHLLRRHSDGLPVLLDGGRVQPQRKIEQGARWGDLHDLGLTALMLLSGSASHDGGWPEGLELDSGFRQVLERLLLDQPEHSFGHASEVLQALESVVLPVTEPEPELVGTPRARRVRDREQGAEGRLWPVVSALALSALVGSAIGWFVLKRTSPAAPALDGVSQQPAVSVPSAELEQRQQLISRLQALQVDRGWFLRLVNASKRSSESLDDGSIRGGWTDLAEEWLARIEQLPPAIRAQLGRFQDRDWELLRSVLVNKGVHALVVESLVDFFAKKLSLDESLTAQSRDPFRQLWLASAINNLNDFEFETLKFGESYQPRRLLRITPGAIRLFVIEFQQASQSSLEVNGNELVEMIAYSTQVPIKQYRSSMKFKQVSLALSKAETCVQLIVFNGGLSTQDLSLGID